MDWLKPLYRGEDFIGDDSVALVLGDNIFHGNGLSAMLQRAEAKEKGATVFGYQVMTQNVFGVVEFDDNMNAILSRKNLSIQKIKLCCNWSLFL